MLESLKFQNVGPVPSLEIDFKERLNFIIGDNGLNKTFILDAAWWAITRTWARLPIVPHFPPARPNIKYQYQTKTGGSHKYESTFDRESEEWIVKQDRPPIPIMVIYFQADGGFSVWDPARNHWEKGTPNRPKSYLFTAEQVWEGNDLCEGLIRDWASWQREDRDAFKQLKSVLKTLSPDRDEPIAPGELRKVSLEDPKRHPTLKIPYGEDVALIHASAGMRRVVALAYLLVWTWQEHLEACKLRGDTPVAEIIFLIDEMDAHLHPGWQQRVVPALLAVMVDDLPGDHNTKIQIITATHSPLVLASIYSIFEEALDGIFLLDLKNNIVSLHEQSFVTSRSLKRLLMAYNYAT